MAIFEQGGGRGLKHPAMAHLPVLSVLLIYLVTGIAWTLPLTGVWGMSHTAQNTGSRSCPMCADEPGGTHHCRCCEGGEECQCGLSASDDSETSNSLEPGILSSNPNRLPLLGSHQVLILQVPLHLSPQSNVPTPPPEG